MGAVLGCSLEPLVERTGKGADGGLRMGNQWDGEDSLRDGRKKGGRA